MAKIVDPDQLNQGTEVVISTLLKTVQLAVAGNLDDTSPGATSGVTGQAEYSFLKEEWLTDTNLNKFRFPIKAFTKFEFIYQNGWAPADAQTRQLKRDCGWEESVGAEAGDLYAGFISLGAFDDAGDQGYFQQVAGFTASTTNFDKTGDINEAVLIFDADGSDFTGFFKAFLREQGKLYASYDLLNEQNLAALEATLYRFPLENSTDINITETDGNIDSLAPYTGMTIDYLAGSGFTTWASGQSYAAETVVQDSGGRWWFTDAGGTSAGNDSNLGGGSDTGVTWEAYAGEVQIGANYYAYNRIVDANGGSKGEVYNWMMRQLRLAIDINDATLGSPNQNTFGTVNGDVAEELCTFRGNVLVTAPGVAVVNFDVNDQNEMEFNDITVDGGGLDTNFVPVTSTARTFPFTSTGNLNFSQNLVDEADVNTRYQMYWRYTTRQAQTDFDITGATGAQATIGSTLGTFTRISSGDYFIVRGFATSGNNGLWQADANGTANSILASKVDGVNPTNEAAGASVELDEFPYESPSALIVDDSGAADIAGQVTAATIAWTFDYDGNTQGGRTPGADAAVVVAFQGLSGATVGEALHTITRASSQNIACNADDERNYANP